FFATVRILLGTRVALWAAALLAVSTYAVHFSAFAVEIGALLFWVPAVAFALVAWLRQPSAWRAAATGLVLGLSLFTYPGVLVAYAAIALGCLAAALLGPPCGHRAAGRAQP